ncbi:MAG: YecA family protein [Desulfitobacteriaceae bacterium]
MGDKFDTDDEALMKDALSAAKQYSLELREKEEAKLWKAIEVPLTLEKALVGLTKTELDDLRQIWKFPGLSTLRKQDLINELLRRMSEDLESFFPLLDRERYDLMQDISAKGGLIATDDFDFDQVNYWRKRGLIFSGLYQGQRILTMPEEVSVVFQAVDGPELRRMVERNTEWINISQGLLFYDGVLSVDQLTGMLKNLCGSKPDHGELLLLLTEASNYYDRIRYHEYFGFADFRIFDPEKVVREQNARPSIDYYPFTKKQLLKVNSPDYVERTPAYQRLADSILANFDVSQEDVERIIADCATMVNFAERPTAIVEYLASQFESPSFDVLQQMINALMEFMNSTRQWILKGHAPSEIRREEEKFLRPLPQKPFIPQLAQGAGEVIDFRTRTKVGRNDPCPCGSGKKFKRCCGRT